MHRCIIVFTSDQRILIRFWLTPGSQLWKIRLSSCTATAKAKPSHVPQESWLTPGPWRSKVRWQHSVLYWRHVVESHAKRIIFSSRAIKLMLSHSPPGSAYRSLNWPAVNWLVNIRASTRLLFNHWRLLIHRNPLSVFSAVSGSPIQRCNSTFKKTNKQKKPFFALSLWLWDF